MSLNKIWTKITVLGLFYNFHKFYCSGFVLFIFIFTILFLNYFPHKIYIMTNCVETKLREFTKIQHTYFDFKHCWLISKRWPPKIISFKTWSKSPLLVSLNRIIYFNLKIEVIFSLLLKEKNIINIHGELLNYNSFRSGLAYFRSTAVHELFLIYLLKPN